MILCLSCRYLAASGSIYCPRCQRSFGTRICPNGHRNTLDRRVIACATCAQIPLSDGTLYLSLRWIVQAIAALLVFVLWRWAIHHTCLLLCGGVRLGMWGLSMVFDAPPNMIVAAGLRLVAWWVVLWILSGVFPTSVQRPLRLFLVAMPKFGIRVIGRTVGIVRDLIVGHRTSGQK